MHIETAVISTSVAAAFFAASGVSSVVAARRVSVGADFSQALLQRPIHRALAVALVFALQMLNFAIPGVGSSGHVVGGVLLALLLGPWRAFLSMGPILILQSFFFADGGVLALGANVFNMGVVPCLIVYPLLRKVIANDALFCIVAPFASGILGAALAAAQITASGMLSLDLGAFFGNMLGLHAMIGLAEGVLTLVVSRAIAATSVQRLACAMGVAVLLSAGVLQLWASSFPDGLEFSLMKCSAAEAAVSTPMHLFAEELQQHTALLADYVISGLSGWVSASAAGLVGSALLFGLSALAFRKANP